MKAPAPALLGLIALATLAICGFRFAEWRSAKVALLEPPAPSVAIASTDPAPSPCFLLFGDSRIAQWRPLPDRPFRICVDGQPGQTAIRLVPRFQTSMIAHNAAGALIQVGINDAVAASLLGEEARRAALSRSIAAIDAMAAAAHRRGIRLIIIAVIPPIRPDFRRRIVYRGNVDAYVERLNGALPAIAARHGATLADPMPLLRGADGQMAERFRMDALHFTPAAYRALNSLIPATITAESAADPRR